MDADVNSGESYATSNMCSVEYDLHGGTPILSADYVRAGSIIPNRRNQAWLVLLSTAGICDTMYTMPWYFADPVYTMISFFTLKWVTTISR